MSSIAAAEVRTYRQVKDIAAKENGKVSQSNKNGDLFEYTFNIDLKKNMITRTKVQRLDDRSVRNDATVYNITQKRKLLASDAGNGGPAFIAVRKDGGELLELSHKFAFTMRVSPFSQVITGIYKRVYYKDRDKAHDKSRWDKSQKCN
jgi:hypothetical protein